MALKSPCMDVSKFDVGSVASMREPLAHPPELISGHGFLDMGQ